MSLLGSQWPNCYLHCGWIEQTYNYGFHLLDGLDVPYDLTVFVHDTHQMYLSILLLRFDANQVLHTTPHTPTDAQERHGQQFSGAKRPLCFLFAEDVRLPHVRNSWFNIQLVCNLVIFSIT